MALLASESLWHVLGSFPSLYLWTMRAGCLPRFLLRSWAVLEVYRIACRRLSRRAAAAAVGSGLVLAGVIGSGHAWLVGSGPFDSMWTANQYGLLALIAACWSLVVSLRVRPVMENRDHKAHRVGLARALTITAAAGLFARSGVAWVLLPIPYSRDVQQAVGMAAYWLAALNWGWMAYRMGRTLNIARAKFADDDPIMQAFMAEMEAKG